MSPLGADTPADVVAKTVNGYDAVVAGREPLTAALYRYPHPPKFVSKYGVGLDNIAPEVFKNSVVCWEPGVNAFAVAEQTIGLLLAVSRNIARCDRLLRHGQWWKNGGYSISGKLVAVIGVGCVGMRVVPILRSFGCQVVGVDLLDRSEFLQSHGSTQADDLAAILPIADVVTLHIPLTDLTRKMVDQTFLARMKPGSILINTSRGEVIDEAALVDALKSTHLAGAGLDVFEEEPTKNSELIGLENVVCTPHTAGNSLESVLVMGRAAIRGLAKTIK